MSGANLKKAVYGAFGRTSPELSLVVIVAFAVMLLSTAYLALAFTPAEFVQKPEVQGYENRLTNVATMDDWTRTNYYWTNNLGVAGVFAVGTPTYFGFNSVVANNYWMGISIAYYYHHPAYGAAGMVAVAAQFFVHGVFELTGFYLIAAASLRVGWNLWKGMGHLVAMTGKGKRLSWRLSKWEKREIFKHKRAIKLLLSDFIVVLAVGAFLIFFAGPIEAYVSPRLGSGFYSVPALAAVFLAAIGLVYVGIVLQGFNGMRGKIKLVWKEIRLAFRGRWRPAQLSLLAFVIFLALMLVRVIILA